MSKLFAILVLCAIASTAMAADADTEVDVPTTRPRRGKPLVAARQVGKSFGNQKVVTVPKGDPRARGPVEAVAPAPKPAREPRVIVEADVAEPIVLAPAVAPAAVPVAAPSRLLKAVAPSTASACLRSWNGATAAAKAAAYQANYKSRGVRYSQPNRQFGITANYADCSSFVTSILNDIGMNCLFAAGRYTAYMNEQIRARGGYSQVAKVGDIVMWGSHTGMIVRVCAPGSYSMVAMGNSGAGRAECKTPAGLAAWGSGGWLGFWTPRQ